MSRNVWYYTFVLEKKGRLEYLRGNGEDIKESQSDKMLRMLSVQHPPEATPEHFQPSGFPQRQILDVLQNRVEQPTNKNKKKKS